MEAKIEIHIGNSSIVVEGSEAFAKEQADFFYDYCSSNMPASGEDIPPEAAEMAPTGEVATAGTARDFYSKFSPQKESDSALVLAGWIYTQRGSEPFDTAELKALFDEVGVPRPARLDMTIKNFQSESKKLFQPVTGGMFRPTVYGENYFKSEMKLVAGSIK